MSEVDCAGELNVIAFVNNQSGGKLGPKVFRKLQKILGPANVYDLQEQKPEEVLSSNKYPNSCRIIVAGGDGTSAWILSALDKSNTLTKHAMAVLPIGTGNDMAGFLRWGYVFRRRNLLKIVDDVKNGDVIYLDRWKITTQFVSDINNAPSDSGVDCSLSSNVINNYLSIGGDAEIALKFHHDRNKKSIFPSQMRNRIHYMRIYLTQLCDRSRRSKSLADDIDLECDDKQLNRRLRHLKPDTLLILNIRSYSGGANPWGTAREISMVSCNETWRKQRCDDGYIEVIAYTNLELGEIIAGGRGHRLSQCKELKLTSKAPLPMKVDGEPVLMRPCVLTVALKNKALCIRRRL